jgi:hypothetical protein
VPALFRRPRSDRSHVKRRSSRCHFEQLEPRHLLSAPAGSLLVLHEIGSNNTLDHAQLLPNLNTVSQVQVLGQLTNDPAGAGEVDWYCFTLGSASRVQLDVRALPAVSPLQSVLSLYNSDPNDPVDYYDPTGNRLLVQQDGAKQGGNASVAWSLAPGTYYVAVSGSGDLYFNPFLVGSGYAGSTGPYNLSLTATDLGLTSSDGPIVLASDPQPNATLNLSPFVLRFDLSSALNTSGNVLQGVQLIENPTGQFGQGDQVVPLASWNFSTSANELQLTPSAPLAPGSYEVILAGLETPGRFVLANMAGQPLGKDALHPLGQDYVLRFQVDGIEGNTGLTTMGDDTAATANPLGDITNAGLVQVTGAIGVDPSDPVPFDASDVNLYRFQVTGSGRYALTAEVFAGRIGSPLMPAISLLQYDPSDNVFHILQSNAGTQNGVVADNSTTPLFFDAALTAGLTPGVYYLAVTDNGNAPQPDPAGLPLITYDDFDPVAAEASGMGFTTGNYVLNLQVTPDNDAPQVTSVTLAGGTPLRPGAALGAPPSQINVTFSEPVSLLQLLQGTYLETGDTAMQAAYIAGPNGQYFLRLESMDDGGREADFILYDRLPAGSYQLHLSGAAGLTDLAGNPLTGNQPGGDFVIPFAVVGPTLGTWREDVEPNDSPAQAQGLGVLFPNELVNGVEITRDAQSLVNSQPTDTADYYTITVLQAKQYDFVLDNTGTVPGLQVSISGGSLTNWVNLTSGNGFSFANLAAGTYLVRVDGWTAAQRFNVTYQLTISIGQSAELPPPLTQGAGPLIQIRRVTGTNPVAPGPALPLPLALPPADSSVTVPAGLGLNSASGGRNDIPAGVLAALGAAPLTGLDSPGPATSLQREADGSAQALALAPGLLSPELILPLPVLLPEQDLSASFSPPLSLNLILPDLAKHVGEIDWNWAVEYLHNVADRLGLPEMLMPPVQDASPLEEPLEDPETIDSSVQAIELNSQPALPPRGTLAALALLLFPALAATGQSRSMARARPSFLSGQNSCSR